VASFLLRHPVYRNERFVILREEVKGGRTTVTMKNECSQGTEQRSTDRSRDQHIEL